MSLYPSLEDMKVDKMVRAQMAQNQAPSGYPPAYHQPGYPQITAPTPSVPTAMYPALGEYMGLELSHDVIALNMPEYQVQTVSS